MNKFAGFIVNHKLLIIIIFAIVLIGSVVGLLFVEKNSDIQSYLSDDSMTAKGRDALYNEFGILGEMSIAIKTENEEYLAEFLSQYDGKEIIKNVMWAGNFREIEKLVSENERIQKLFGDNFADLSKKFIKSSPSGESIYLVSIYFNYSSSDEKVIDFVGEIEGKLNEAVNVGAISEFALGGMAANSRDMIDSSIGEIPVYLVIAVAILLVILFLTTRSWLEPFIFILTLGISILINMGTNVIFGSVSIITYSASTILQLALAMDYTIFLMHCYYDERKRNPLLSPDKCMTQAIPKTMRSVFASALTTVGGFLALLVMDFGIGMDLGLVLAKGVMISLITVVFLQPVMILMVSKPLEKTKHRFITPRCECTTKASIKGRIPIIALALLLIIPTFIGQLNVPLSYMTMTKEASEVSSTQQVINDSANQIIIIAPGELGRGNYKKHYEFVEKLDTIEGLQNGMSIYSIIPEDLYDSLPNLAVIFGFDLNELSGTLFSNGYTLYIYEVTTGVENETTYANLDKILQYADESFGKGTAYVTGLAQASSDMARVTPSDFIKVSCISAAIIFVILLLSFRSFKLSTLLLLVIELGIWINLSIVTLAGITINFMSYLIISSVQLGATVDYAILAASKYKEVRGEGCNDIKKAIVEGFKRAMPSILVSASVLMSVCIAVFFVSSNMIISEITILIACGAAMSTFLVLFLLPAAMTFSENAHKFVINHKLKKLGVADEDKSVRNDMAHMLSSCNIELQSCTKTAIDPIESFDNNVDKE